MDLAGVNFYDFDKDASYRIYELLLLRSGDLDEAVESFIDFNWDFKNYSC
jgi:hypothetical protein